MNFQHILVLGAGTMGSGIAQMAAQAGFYVAIFDVNKEALIRAKLGIEKSIKTLVEKNKLTPETGEKVKSLLSYTSNLDDCVCDVVIEAIIENMDAKTAMFNQLAEINHSDLIFASNTSSLSISDLQERVMNPSRVVGMHFFNPATIMPLVEIVKGNKTSEEVVTQIFSLTQQLKKVPVLCSDTPGFIVNRVARPYYLEAMRMVTTGMATLENVDEIMEATGFKMGPFKLMDIIGLDINYAVSNLVYDALGKPKRLQPSDMQQKKITENKLGRKTNEGFYKY